MTVYIVSLEWNDPPSEVTGETGILGVYATREAAAAAALAERQTLEAEERTVYNFTYHEHRYCAGCGAENAATVDGFTPCPEAEQHDEFHWCEYCGAELTERETCENDHDEWDIDVHVSEHEVQE